MHRILSSKKGSTLVMVLVTMSVLSIMGIAILSLALMNFKVQEIEKKRRFALYAAEAGLEEAYALTAQKVQETNDMATNNAKNDLDLEVKSQRAQYQAWLEAQHSEDPDDDDDYSLPEFYTSSGALKEEVVTAWVEKRHRELYVKRLQGYEETEEQGLKEIIERKSENNQWGQNLELAKQNGKEQNPPTLRLLEETYTPFFTTEQELSSLDENSKMSFVLQSNYTHKDGMQKEIEVTLKVGIPKYNLPFAVQTKVAKLKPNILWTKALAAGRNIEVTGGEVFVQGDVYAFGTKPSNSRSINNNEDFGGIIVGKDEIKGALNIQGDVATNSYIHSLFNNSTIDINGSVYADSIVIHEGVDRSNITIRGQANTRDDIELNGTKSKIHIMGDYYGFTDGSEDSQSEGVAENIHSQSSSIIINSSDIGRGSSLQIDGQIFLAGTVFVDLSTEKNGVYVERGYKTGESVSIKGNYLAYGKYLNDSFLRSYFGEEAKKFRVDNIFFEAFDPLVMARAFWSEQTKEDGSIEIEPQAFTTFDSADYFYYAAKQEERELQTEEIQEEDKWINLGGTQGIVFNDNDEENSKIIYSLGATISNGRVYPKKIGLQGSIENDIKLPKWKRYYNQIVQLGNLALVNDLLNDSEEDSLTIPEESNIMQNRFQFSSDYSSKTQDTYENEVIAVNKSYAPIYIYGNGSTAVAGDLRWDFSNEDAKIKGVIVSKGDVHFIGAINFSGTVITEGDIIFEGQGIKRIENRSMESIQHIANTIYSTEALRNGFAPEEIVQTNFITLPNDLNKDENGNIVVYDSKAMFDDEGKKKYNSIKEIVKFTNWKLIK